MRLNRSTAGTKGGSFAEPYWGQGQGEAASQDDCVADIGSSWLEGRSLWYVLSLV